ncbi:aminoglycoside phosphotransferase [Micromonospora aurantiaca]|uniref:Aminoglycoside phosphotransferase n=1 Tax=Micromonospora aurantiaca (nom. illeg.) TaxID=47850 RepID=A0ABQ6UMK2_9ACTN|nr:aminoglycoside phosphotransferase [Micromonospora aurantiaca]KAB1118479.1 aminoglycoside phosphotransferase [Micromonospora aurantiaca]
MRSDWTALPRSVITRITDQVGGAFEASPAPDGNHAQIASTVTGPSGPVFVKAACGEWGVRSLRYELAVTQAVDRYPPALRWHFEADGWLVVGTEHLAGLHPDLSPGSPDLDLLTAALKDLQQTPAPGDRWFTPAGRLGFTHPAMHGGTLVHSDLNPTNLIVTPHGLRIVDWAWATKAAAWVELALLVQWLIGGGHTADQAEDWLRQFPAWTVTSADVLNHFASTNAAKWATKARHNTERWVHDLAQWTGDWAIHRAHGA